MKRRPIQFAILTFLLALGTALSADPPPEPPEESPREIGLVEEATGRLAQVDVTVSGPPEAIGSLEAADFELLVGGRFIEKFLVDRICNMPGAA